MAAMLTSRVTLRVPVKARAVSTRASRSAVVRVSADKVLYAFEKYVR